MLRLILAAVIASAFVISGGTALANDPNPDVVASPTATDMNTIEPTILSVPYAEAIEVGKDKYLISSTQTGWQGTSAHVKAGETVTFDYISGTWSVDYHLFPFVGPNGYWPSIDQQIFQGCKLDASQPYGVILVSIGDGAAFVMRPGVPVVSPSSGYISFHINDHDDCLGDNDGAIVVKVSSFNAPGARGIPNFKLPWQEGESWFFTGGTHDWGKGSGTRSGLDFSPSGSNRTVVAATGGTITYRGTLPGVPDAGQVIKLSHGYGWETWYLHLESFKVQTGSKVKQGQPIAVAGGTGGWPVHIHIELVYQGVHVTWDQKTIDGWEVHATCPTSGTVVVGCKNSDYNGYMVKNGRFVIPEEKPTGDQLVQSSNGSRR